MEKTRQQIELLFSRFSDLHFKPKELETFYKAIVDGKIEFANKGVKKYTDAMAKNGQLLRFIDFLNEAKEISYDVTYGNDGLKDAVADTYYHKTTVAYGLGGSELARKGSDAMARLSGFIHEIEQNYSWQISQERQKIEDRMIEAAERSEAERQVVGKKVQKYIDAINEWNKKDCYWKGANMPKMPRIEMYGITEEDLKEFGYYDKEEKNKRLIQYQAAYQQYLQANSWLKNAIFRGKAAPSIEEYGLKEEDIPIDLSENEYSTMYGRGR